MQARPFESTLADIYNTPLSDLLFTSPCLPDTPHVFYGSAHILAQERVSGPEPSREIKVIAQENIFQVVKKGDLEGVLKLMEFANDVESATKNSVLHLAASLGHLDIVKSLVEKGNTNLNALNSEGEVAFGRLTALDSFDEGVHARSF
jgi:hypothetical protein